MKIVRIFDIILVSLFVFPDLKGDEARTDAAKRILALFQELDSDELNFLDYAVLPGYARAINELQELGFVECINDVVGTICLL